MDSAEFHMYEPIREKQLFTFHVSGLGEKLQNRYPVYKKNACYSSRKHQSAEETFDLFEKVYNGIGLLTKKMYLQYYLDDKGNRVYTLQKKDPKGQPTLSAHPARFSIEDKYSRERITMKRRHGLLLIQKPAPIY